jgi:citronellol/citronellal dehydrogenase
MADIGFSKDLFSEKIVLVTGGGTGIGYKTSEIFLQCNAKVIICGRKKEQLELAEEQLKNFGEISSFVADIRESEQLEQLADYIFSKYGRLDILINNAGGQFPTTAEDLNEKGWKAVINNNLHGTWLATHTMAIKFFIPQKMGVVTTVIVNHSRGVPGMVHTGAARAGIDNFTKTLAVEWANKNIRLNCIAPGIIQSSGLENYPPELTQGIANKIPTKRIGTTTEVANAIIFISSHLASYITGETLYVDGGSRLWGDFWEID